MLLHLKKVAPSPGRKLGMDVWLCLCGLSSEWPWLSSAGSARPKGWHDPAGSQECTSDFRASSTEPPQSQRIQKSTEPPLPQTSLIQYLRFNPSVRNPQNSLFFRKKPNAPPGRGTHRSPHSSRGSRDQGRKRTPSLHLRVLCSWNPSARKEARCPMELRSLRCSSELRSCACASSGRFSISRADSWMEKEKENQILSCSIESEVLSPGKIAGKRGMWNPK